ncbi:sterigmatocystin biosynthesis P450 monooxygenase stcL [Aspergillus carlsbadensis]|nr:sterigmatocystin biosynthesis P450 monooxygenase stcL [Aspergillus carlsbadensis]
MLLDEYIDNLGLTALVQRANTFIDLIDGRWMATLGLLITGWAIYDTFYNLYISPLSHFPGPKLWAFSRIPYQWSIIRGQSHRKMLEMHNRYGAVLRVGPDELSFNSPQAFQDIYRARPGRPQYQKDPKFYGSLLNAVRRSIVGNLDDKTHSRHRRLLANAFSERAMREQEGTVLHYSDLLVRRLRERTAVDKEGTHTAKADIKEWFNFIAFDVTGDLLFAETFDCLEESKLHPWIALIFAFVKGITLAGVINQFTLLRKMQEVFLPEKLRKQMLQHLDYSSEKADRRLKKGTARPDFMSALLKQGLSDAEGNFVENPALMSHDEIHQNCAFISIAGSETSATTLSGCVYFLSKHPETLKRLNDEIRTAFTNDSDITAAICVGLPYLNAVIEETLRLYPPVAASLPRVVPSGGDVVDGYAVPEKTIVSTHHYASYHADANFALAEDFIPERWLGTDARFAADKRSVLQPFSLGQRGCLGKNLAYMESRLILTKLLFNFDIELCPESQEWIVQEMYVNWDKPQLHVWLRDRMAVASQS